jgi:hypothetical protein
MEADNKNQSLAQAFNYHQYLELVESLVKENNTTGPDKYEEKISFTKLNLQRMKRIQKSFTVDPDLINDVKKLKRSLIWLVLTEAWCGDASQNLPVINQVAEMSDGKIKLSILLRDEHPQLMDHFLTNGSRAIPKLICIDAETKEIKGSWGPRPANIQQLVKDWKLKNSEAPHSELLYNLHLFYAQDKAKSIQRELAGLLGVCGEKTANTDFAHVHSNVLLPVII